MLSRRTRIMSQNQIFRKENHMKKFHLNIYVLNETVESRLKAAINQLLEERGRIDLVELVYMASKELIVNSTKAAIKRLFFLNEQKNPFDQEEYQSGMQEFKVQLSRENLPIYYEKIREKELKTSFSLLHDEQKIVIMVASHFLLFEQEEKRIRQKFKTAQKYDNLVEFYMDHGDSTEGAGLGITLVEILMAQNGFDKHLFTIYCSPATKQTIAKIIIPLDSAYKSNRQLFEEEKKKQNISNEILRKAFAVNE